LNLFSKKKKNQKPNPQQIINQPPKVSSIGTENKDQIYRTNNSYSATPRKKTSRNTFQAKEQEQARNGGSFTGRPF